MAEQRGRWLAEFVLIVIGVLAALAVDDFREARADHALERHILEGIQADLNRDLGDIQSGIDGAKARMAGTDELLGMLADPDAGAVRIPPMEGGDVQRVLSATLEDELTDAHAVYPPGSVTAQQALLMGMVMLRFDLADATYREATASGQVAVIQDLDLRSRITQY